MKNDKQQPSFREIDNHLQNCMDRGVKAFLDGLTKYDNDFEPGSLDFDAWASGFSIAENGFKAPLSNETKVVESDHGGIKTKGHLGGTTPPYINEMMEEKKICGTTCGCTNEHDCYGEAALNFIELGENKISLSFSIVDETIINGAKYTEKQAVELAMKIMNHYYTDNVD